MIKTNKIPVSDSVEHLLLLPFENTQKNACAIMEGMIDLVEMLLEKQTKPTTEQNERPD